MRILPRVGLLFAAALVAAPPAFAQDVVADASGRLTEARDSSADLFGMSSAVSRALPPARRTPAGSPRDLSALQWGVIIGATGGLTEAQDFNTDIFRMSGTHDVALDQSDDGFRVFAGPATRYFSFEVGYSDLGRAAFTGTWSGSTWDYPYVPGPVSGEIAVTGRDLTLTGRWPIARATFMGLRLGHFRWERTAQVADSSGSYDVPSARGNDFLYGATLAQALGDRVEVFFDFLNYVLDPPEESGQFRFGQYEVRTMSLGLRYRFGPSFAPAATP